MSLLLSPALFLMAITKLSAICSGNSADWSTRKHFLEVNEAYSSGGDPLMMKDALLRGTNSVLLGSLGLK